jgi:uncharacterized protein YdeI (YjbR/CyaY-like superfamily)
MSDARHQTMKELYVRNRNEWRQWLATNYDKSVGVWLVFYKKHSGTPTLQYDEAVEEALCFGWIDSIIKKRDDDSYTRKDRQSLVAIEQKEGRKAYSARTCV